MIAVVGSVNLDLVATVDTFPRPGETIVARGYRATHGGKGANQAVAAARLDAEVEFIGSVGDDAVGSDLTAGLEREGVGTASLFAVAGPSGTALIMVEERGENSIVVVPGANERLSVEGSAEATLARATTVLCQLEIPMSVVAAAFEATDGTTLLNAAPARKVPEDLLVAADVLIVNEVELEALAGSIDPVSARRLGVDTVITTLGAKGAQVVTKGDVAFIPAPEVAVRDTTGAGDAFCGAFAAAVDAGHDVFEAAARGVVAGSMATTRIGAREAMPTSRALDREMRRRP